MKNFDAKKLLSIVFISIIVFFMGTIAVRLVLTKVFYIYPKTNTAESPVEGETAEAKDWSVDYPFTGDYSFAFSGQTEIANTNPEQVSAVESYENSVKTIEGNIDYYTSNLLFGRMKFVEMNASFNKLVGMNIVSGTDTVLVMRNGYLTFQADPVDMKYAKESTAYFSDWLDENEINYLYVQFPSKENYADNQLPYGVEDNNNKNADELIAFLSQSNIPHIDLRKSLNESFDDYFSCFFKTDHHWTPETGVWAAGQIANELNSRYNYGLSTDIGNLDSYNIDVYEGYCFGSQGKKVTLKYADPEDISLIYPKTETDFTVSYNAEEPLNGSFENTLLEKSVFNEIDHYNISTYSAYLRGNNSLITIHNNKVNNGKKLVYIMDSFSASVIPYLATDIEDILVLDLRYFNGSVTNAIETFGADTVVVAYNPSVFSADTSHNGTFNFE